MCRILFFEYCRLVVKCFCIFVKKEMYVYFLLYFYLFLDFSIEMVVIVWKSSEIVSFDKFVEKI